MYFAVEPIHFLYWLLCFSVLKFLLFFFLYLMDFFFSARNFFFFVDAFCFIFSFKHYFVIAAWSIFIRAPFKSLLCNSNNSIPSKLSSFGCCFPFRLRSPFLVLWVSYCWQLDWNLFKPFLSASVLWPCSGCSRGLSLHCRWLELEAQPPLGLH